VHQPIVDELARRGTPFHGVLYAGLMLTAPGPKVLEYNVRFGDPETQVVLPRLDSDLVALLHAACQPGGLKRYTVEVDRRPAVTVVLASRGYPATSSSGDVITGTDEALASNPLVTVFYAGTARNAAGELVTAGGRVLAVTALGDTLGSARAAAYTGAQEIAFDGQQQRSDIAAAAAEAD